MNDDGKIDFKKFAEGIENIDFKKFAEDFGKTFQHKRHVTETKTKVQEFLKDCESKGLIQFPKTDTNDFFRKAESRAEAQMLSGYSDIIIQCIHLMKPNGVEIPDSVYTPYMQFQKIHELRYESEELGLVLKAILDPSKISFDVHGVGELLGNVINVIAGKDKSKKLELRELFQVDLRNALSHNDFEIKSDRIIWYDKDNNSHDILNDDNTAFEKISTISLVVNEYTKSKK